MKKMFFLLGVMTIVLAGVFSTNIFAKETVDQKEIADKLIRFHVIANSDKVEDQNLKLKVRDAILIYMSPKLKNAKDIEESRNILRNNTKEVQNIAENVIKTNGFKNSVKVELSHENFPIKSYGNITLHQGNYEAYRVIIGEGKGQNWWCVMFPPLCFIDITKGEIEKQATEKQMKRVVSQEEYESIDNSADKSIKIEFKIVNVVKDIFK